MKKLFLLIFSASCLLPLASAQQYGWVDLTGNVPDSNYIQKNLRDIFFIGQEGWITGTFEDNLRVYHTTNGGATFTTQNVPENSGNGMGILMRSPLEGYLVTNEGHVLRTTDGGNSWTTIGTGLGMLYSVSFPPLPDTSGYICGGWGGKICRVTGSNIVVEWTTPQTLTSIVFPVNSSEGWVCGGPTIRHRTSGGWQVGDQNYSTGNWYNAIFFTDNQHGWSVGGPSSGQGTIIHTLNGTDWVGVSNVPNNNLNDLFFIDNQEGWAVGNYIILQTTDGGLTWTKDPSPLTDSAIFYSVFAVNNHELYVCGSRGTGELQRQVLLKYTRVDGVQEQEGMEVMVHPNPTLGKFQITTQSRLNHQLQSRWLSGQVRKIEIVDLSGNVIKSLNNRTIEQLNNGTIELDIIHVQAGIYFVRISLDNQTIVKKIIKL